MNTRQNVKSDIEQQLNSIHMSERMRSAALNDCHKAEAFVELFTWVGSKVNWPYADAFAKPSPKH